jgi:A/G-specific adenine glycosylase
MRSPPPSLRRTVLACYATEKRDLPWRRTRDPYAIWVSEIMLQQTRVETVVPFYERFLRRFPDAGALARAREPAVLAAWSGLGYYRRARHLHAAARVVACEHGGRIPSGHKSLLALPGIGAYTAAAIASIAFGAPEAAVDGNVIRVLARIAGFRGRRDSAALRIKVAAWAETLARGPRPGDWTQALMELGATVCLPRDPLCARCPAARHCVARESGDPGRYPEASAVKAPRAERRLLLLASAGDRVLLVPDEADASVSWTLPYARLGASALSTRAARALAARHLEGSAAPSGPLATFQHRTFSHNMTYEVWSLKLGRGMETRNSAVWATGRQRRGPPLRAPTLKALKNLDP